MKDGDGRIGNGKGNMDPAMTPTIRVEIYNQTYNIRSDGDSEYITELAEFVDNRMREISSGTLTVDSLKVAILAALHIADELWTSLRSVAGKGSGFLVMPGRARYFHIELSSRYRWYVAPALLNP